MIYVLLLIDFSSCTYLYIIEAACTPGASPLLTHNPPNRI